MSRRWSSRIASGSSSTTPLTGGGQAPAFRSMTSTSALNANNIIITKPAGVVLDDMMIAVISTPDPASIITPPAGWTAMIGAGVTGLFELSGFWKRATGSEPANYTFTSDIAVDILGAISAYQGIVTVGNPINSQGLTNTEPINPLDGSVVFTGPDNATPGSMVVAFYGSNMTVNAAQTWTPPGGLTERYDTSTSNNNISHSLSDMLFSAGGNVGNIMASISPPTASTLASALIIALSPAVAGGGGIFEGVAENVEDYSGIRIFVHTDQASASNGLEVHWSPDGVASNFTLIDKFTISANQARFESVQVKARFVRIRYINGGVTQGFFRLQTILVPEVDQAQQRVEGQRLLTATASVPSLSSAVIVTTTADEAARTVEVTGYGALLSTLTTISTTYLVELLLNDIVKHAFISRSDAQSWMPVRLTTDGGIVKVRVDHDDLLAQTFRGLLGIRELL